ncbi:MAG TPA: serine hydrolase [Leptolyngbyaceae cyanobacterium M33_DOE_097]|nr:serine hydrolase [Leptolyngbyaceae cyanobacterium M33_DOE_097]
MPDSRNLPPKHHINGYASIGKSRESSDRTARFYTRDGESRLKRDMALNSQPDGASKRRSAADSYQPHQDRSPANYVDHSVATPPAYPGSWVAAEAEVPPSWEADEPYEASPAIAPDQAAAWMPPRPTFTTQSVPRKLSDLSGQVPERVAYRPTRSPGSSTLGYGEPRRPVSSNATRRPPVARGTEPEPTRRRRTASSSCFAPVPPQRGRSQSRPGKSSSRSYGKGLKAVLYTARMVIFSIGVGVLAGTIMSAWDPSSRAPADASQNIGQTATISEVAPSALGDRAPEPVQAIPDLQTAVQAIADKYADATATFMPSAFILDLDTNAFVDVNGSKPLAAASVIKVPILVAFFQDVDAGKIRLDEMLVMRKELIASEAGSMQYRPVGSKFSALETVTKMIEISDNTATNMLIDRLGGAAVLNERFKSWGLANTSIHNLLPDVEGTNITSAKDMSLLLARISQGELVSARSRDRLLSIMRKTINNSLLPRGLGAKATIAHKTGTIAISLGDAGLVDLPNGKRYAISVLVKRPANDRRANSLIQQTSRAAYDHFMKPSVLPAATTPTPNTQTDSRQAASNEPVSFESTN